MSAGGPEAALGGSTLASGRNLRRTAPRGPRPGCGRNPRHCDPAAGVLGRLRVAPDGFLTILPGPVWTGGPSRVEWAGPSSAWPTGLPAGRAERRKLQASGFTELRIL